jgi:hypothetical protein
VIAKAQEKEGSQPIRAKPDENGDEPISNGRTNCTAKGALLGWDIRRPLHP